jgi:peptidoglycan L-alanyl-D-glutamate endopeptidase CwlK
MSYKLGKRSLEKLEGVDERMAAVVRYAISVTKQDFSVICGLRTIEEQRALVAKGASQTMKSKHLDGLAVDLMAYVDGQGGRWELNLYDEIADAMAEGARAIDVGICWGAAWSTASLPYPMDMRRWNGTMEDAMNAYIDKKRDMKKRAFIDAPHFELIV